MTPDLARVITLAKRRGACVRVVDGATWDQVGGHNDWCESPFSHMSLAIDERDRVVYLLASDADDNEAAGSVVHELAHLHATRRESVRHANEYGWMAWEIAVAREARVRRAWDLAMKDYGLGSSPAGLELDGMDWGQLTQDERLAIIADRMKVARKRGIVDARGRAVWRRLPASVPATARRSP
jgi:hypothetical protein